MDEKIPGGSFTGVDVNLRPRAGGERKFQFEELRDGSVVCSLLWQDQVTGEWKVLDSMMALPGSEV